MTSWSYVAISRRRAVFGHRLEDRVEVEQRVVGKVHLGDQPGSDGRPHQREVDVRGPPGVGMVAPWIGPGLDGHEPVFAVAVGAGLADPEEVRIERRRERGLPPVHVAAARVGLPDLDQRVRDRITVLVEHSARDDAALADRLAAGSGVGREIGIVLTELRPTRTRTRGFGECLNDRDQVVRGSPLHRRSIVGVQERRMIVRAPVART